jgi:hypothetical protein
MPGETRRPFGHRCLAALLSSAMFALPALASDTYQKPLGSVAESARAQLDGISATTGATIYSGDVVATDSQGALRLQLGMGQLYLSASSSASLERHAGLATVTLERGSATFSLPDPIQFELETPAGTLRGSGTHATNGQVAIVAANQLVVTASRGALILDNDGELHTIAEGKSYRIVVEQEDSSSPAVQNAPPKAARKHRRKLLFFLIGAGVAVAATIPLWNFGSESPYRPH